MSNDEEAEAAKDAAISVWRLEFEEAGFDFEAHDLDFSTVSAEAIEAMGAALLELRMRDAHDIDGPDSLTFAALRDANSRRCEAAYHPVGAWSMTDWLTAVAGEVGELVKELEPYPSAYYLGLSVSKATGYLANAIKNMRRKETEGWSAHRIKEHSKQAIADEAADVAIYLDLLCYRFGIDLGGAVRKKFNEVSDRTGTDIKL